MRVRQYVHQNFCWSKSQHRRSLNEDNDYFIKKGLCVYLQAIMGK